MGGIHASPEKGLLLHVGHFQVWPVAADRVLVPHPVVVVDYVFVLLILALLAYALGQPVHLQSFILLWGHFVRKLLDVVEDA